MCLKFFSRKTLIVCPKEKNLSPNKKESTEFKELIKFRNIIAHTYYSVSKNDVFNAIQKAKLIDNFIEKIKKRVRI